MERRDFRHGIGPHGCKAVTTQAIAVGTASSHELTFLGRFSMCAIIAVFLENKAPLLLHCPQSYPRDKFSAPVACDSRHCTLTLASCARLKFAHDPGQDWLGQAERMKGQAKCGLGGRPGRLLLMFLREVR